MKNKLILPIPDDQFIRADVPMTKEASYEKGGLEKLSSNKPVSRQELIGAAVEYVELQKEAEVADTQGREDAQNLAELVSNIQKEASSTEVKPVSEQEKVAAALKDETVVAAVKVLKEKGIL